MKMKKFLATAAVLVALTVPSAAQVKDDAFIFSSNSVVSVLDARQSIRLGERLTLAQLKKRLPSYTVKKSYECEGRLPCIEDAHYRVATEDESVVLHLSCRGDC
jgi:hypothetical protein